MFVLFVYAIMLTLVYLHGSSTSTLLSDKMSKLINKQSAYFVIIMMSLFVTLIYVFVDIYQLVTDKKVLEKFEEVQNPSRTDLVTAVLIYMEKLPMVSDLKDQLREKVSDKRVSATQAILNDFSNMNYITRIYF